jgi:hypothetical protein
MVVTIALACSTSDVVGGDAMMFVAEFFKEVLLNFVMLCAGN